MEFFAAQWANGYQASIVQATLANTDFWGTDLSAIEGMVEAVAAHLEAIETKGMQIALQDFIK